MGSDPLLILQEIFHFQSSATAQYFNMLHKLKTDIIELSLPDGEGPAYMYGLPHIDYTKTVLSHWYFHFDTLIGSLDDDMLKPPFPSAQQDERDKVQSTLRKDLEYPKGQAGMLMGLCESGKATKMSSFSIY